MNIDILSIFPQMYEGPFNTSIIKRAQKDGLITINIHDLRDWTEDKHNTVDDRPYGGGPGMIMKVDVVDKAVNELKKGIPKQVLSSHVAKSERDDEVGLQSLPTSSKESQKSNVILLSAKGTKYTQQIAQELLKYNHLILIAGHYEGVDHRVHEHIADEVLSIGDYVLTGGEIPSMVVVDSIVRLIPGVLGEEESLSEESHSKPGYIEYPQYTRPEIYNGWKVPEVLLSGNHADINKWKKRMSKGENK